MTSITLSLLTHNKKECVRLLFQYSFEVKEYVKKGPQVQWTKTHCCFYIVYEEDTLKKLIRYFERADYRVLNKTLLVTKKPCPFKKQ
jgi:hypothetical protein